MKRWHGPGGYRQVLAIGMPLVMSMLSHSLMQFTDRVFLGRYDMDAIAASMPASVTSFLFIAFFMGTVEYVSVFVAQYTGATHHERVGAALWQGIWFCVPASLALAALAWPAPWLFELGGHPDHLQTLEVEYFRILMLGGGLVVLSTALSCFYSGRGMTWPVMLVNMAGAGVNIPLDYALIYGWGWFPELGIVGAGIATVTGSAVMVVLFAVLIFHPKSNLRFGVLTHWRPDPALFRRFLRFGLPGGVNFFIDMFAVTYFIFMVGRIGAVELAATNMAITLDLLAFLPVIGMGMAAGVLVGQAIGAGQPELGVRATVSTVYLCLAWMGALALCFLLLPEVLLELFRDRSMSASEYAKVVEMGTVMLRFIAVFSLFDAVVLTLFGALKGAGDIRFVMWALVGCSLGCVVVPVTLLVEYTDLGYAGPWLCLTFYVICLTVLAWVRFRGGQWKQMRVIEEEAVSTMVRELS